MAQGAYIAKGLAERRLGLPFLVYTQFADTADSVFPRGCRACDSV
jgi:hypothetical protein